MNNIASVIERAFETRDTFDAETASQEIKDAVNSAISMLNTGEARVAEKIDGNWTVNEWL